MAGLALIYIAAGLFEDHPHGAFNVQTMVPLEVGITFVFLAEFSVRFYAAGSRARYLRSHWIDLLALLPAIRYLRFLRVGRLVYVLQAARFLRLGVLARFLVEADRAGDRVKWIANRNGAHVMLLSALGLALIGGSLVWEIEHTANPAMANFGDAIWWAFATMTTVGYGTGPVTVPGRILGGGIMVLGIGCFGLITASVTAYFVHHEKGQHQPTTGELLTVLEDIQTRLGRLEGQAPDRRSG
jgi:voltage-gated potassium channel